MTLRCSCVQAYFFLGRRIPVIPFKKGRFFLANYLHVPALFQPRQPFESNHEEVILDFCSYMYKIYTVYVTIF